MRGNRKYHDRVAGRYDRIYDTPYWRAYRDLSWRHLKAFVPAQRPAWALDIGCGTGWFGVRLLKAGLHMVFLDPSGKMLEQAREASAAESGRSLETKFVQAGMEAMAEVADQSIDFATGQGDPLSFCEEPPKALDELRRVLKPGACAVLSVDHRIAGVRTLLGEAATAAALELLETGRTEWRAERSDERFAMKMFDADELQALLHKAGFEVLSLIGKTCVLQRQHETSLEDPALRARLLAAEETVHGKPQWLGLASHLQVAARRR
jgi:ubiquinone/menaquinone biosynthesis C-methylase UbiE